MKKASLCIAVFLVLFLLVGSYTAQAATLYDIPAFEALNGKWLKITWTIKGADAEAYADVPEKFSEKHTAWACAYWDSSRDWDTYADDDPPAFLDLSFYNEELDFVGSGFMWLSAGTVDNWSGRLKMDMGPYQIWGAGTFTGKENYIKKGQYKSFGAYGYEYAGHRVFGGKVDMKVVTDPGKKLPFTPPDCGWAGH